ncbi:MAG: Smr/MutS family protein [Chitinophagaceae bacterium]|nr:Smr/MutS family protein [Chitinophagaceae bacterium]
MKFQVGDTVLILHSDEEGQVVEIINNKMVMVEVKGVKFPAYIDQLDFPYFKRFSGQNKIPAKKEKRYVDDVRKEKKPAASRVVDGIWLTFLPVFSTDEFGDEVVDSLKVHMINRTEVPYNFNYHLSYFGSSEFALKNTINPFEDFYLHDIPFDDLNDNPVFEIEFSLLKPVKNKAEYYEANLKLKAKQVFARIEELKQKNEPHFSYKLFENYPDKIYEDTLDLGHLASKGYKLYDVKKARQHLEPPRTVVDLHIEKIIDDWKQLSNFEILTIQLKTFEKFYDLALAHIQPSLTVIHGVGEGRLRNEIHDRLRLKREVKSFANQYHPAFGYGATEIFFQY